MTAILGGNNCALKAAVGSLMSKNRCAFEQQAKGLPVNRQAGFRRHPREAPQVAVQAVAIEGFALQIERGVEQFQFALSVGHVHVEPV